MADTPRVPCIALIGLPASGKSTIARLLAESLGLPCLDLDDLIVTDAGKSIPALFEAEGEEGFRERESRALASLAGGSSLVLATGGGIVLRSENRAILKERFRTVWLRVSPQTAALRSQGGSRPLLSGTDPVAKMRELAESREKLYEECANIVVDTEGIDARSVLEALRDKIA